MSDTYFFGVDPAGQDESAVVVFRVRADGVREVISMTTDPDEVTSLLADADFQSPDAA